MTQKVKPRKPLIQHACEKCHSNDVLCSYEDKKLHVTCNSCGRSDSYGVEHCHIKQTKPDGRNCLGVYHGCWSRKEITTVEEVFQRIVGNNSTIPSQEWAFYKGRRTYTAWRMEVPMGRSLSRSIQSLIAKAEEKGRIIVSTSLSNLVSQIETRLLSLVKTT